MTDRLSLQVINHGFPCYVTLRDLSRFFDYDKWIFIFYNNMKFAANHVFTQLAVRFLPILR